MQRQRRRRRRLQLEPFVPSPTPAVIDIATRPLPTRVLVITHVFYPEIWPELARAIRHVPAPTRLVITLVRGRSEHLARSIATEFPAARIDIDANRGRDAWPFVRLVQEGILTDDVDVVLKLHTKASVHRLDGQRWRRRMLQSLCGSPDSIADILQLFAEDHSVGLVTPAGGLLGREFWGSNGPIVDWLAARLGIPVDLDRAAFAGGSMFWARPAAIRRLGDLALTAQDFPPEPLPIDGTLPHAIERFVGVLAVQDRFDVISTAEVFDRLAHVRFAPARQDADAR